MDIGYFSTPKTVEVSSIDDIYKLLADVLITFPSFFPTTFSNKNLNLEIITPLIKRSDFFCKFSDLKLKDLQKGGVSHAGELKIKLIADRVEQNVEMKTASVSFGSSVGGWAPYFMKLYAKRPKTTNKDMYMQVIKYNDHLRYQSADVIHESVIGSLVSHLFDIGVAPSLLKYFGIYACPLTTPNQTTIIFERSNINYMDIAGGEYHYPNDMPVPISDNIIDLTLQITPIDHAIWITQIAHSIFAMKFHFGITHIDLHLKNVMLTYVKNTGDALTWNEPSYNNMRKPEELWYDKKDLSKAQGYIYEMPFKENDKPVRIYVENNGFLPKIIDFGGTVADFRSSYQNRSIPIEFRNDPSSYNFDNVFDALESSNKGDLDFNFFCINLMFNIRKVVEDRYYNESKVKTKLQENFIPLKNFLSAVTNGQSENPRYYDTLRTAWLMRNRDVGTTDDIGSPLRRIFEFFKTKHSETFDGVVYLKLSKNAIKMTPQIISNSVYIPLTLNKDSTASKFSNLNKFIEVNKTYWKACLLKEETTPDERALLVSSLGLKNSNDFRCADTETSSVGGKYNPNSSLRPPFFDKLVDGKPVDSVWTGNKLEKGITRDILEKSKFLNFDMGKAQVYMLKFLPSFVYMDKIGDKETTKFNKNHRSVFYRAPLEEGNLMKTLNVHLIYIGGICPALITLEKKDLYAVSKTRLKDFNQGICINGGYFIVPGNVKNILTPRLDDKLMHPIGYFYSLGTPEYNGTVLPVPKAYQEWFATIYTDKTGGINVVKSVDFLKKHNTVSVPVYEELENVKFNPSFPIGMDYQEIIKLKNGHPDIKKNGFEYSSAFESGPILIWDGNIVFTREVMENEEFTRHDVPFIGSTRYKKYPSAKNYKMWFGEEGETQFMWGARHSNSLMIHNVLCITETNQVLIVLVEGRGFDAVGLDRAQLAELVFRFNVRYAVSLDGGFSANAVFKNPGFSVNEILGFKNPAKDKHGSYWLLNDPDKRELSTVISFGWN